MTDFELITRIQRGEVVAFNTLYQRHHESVWRFLFHLEHNESEARDLFQDVWLRVTVTLMSGKPVQNFRALLFQMAANRHRDHLRRQKVRRLFLFVPQNNFIELEARAPAAPENPEHFEFPERLSRALMRLPGGQREAFLLKEWEGFALSEIATMLKIPVGTVKSRLHKAIQFLQSELKEFDNRQ